MNLTDLRDVLDERSATDHAEARSHLTLSGVQRRLKLRRRRRRIVVASAAALAVLAIGAVSQTIARSPRQSAVEPAQIKPFPEYAQGTRLIASAVLTPGARSVQLTFKPGSTSLVFFVRCAEPSATEEFALAINGHQVMSGSGCGASFISSLPQLGVVAGRPSALVVTFPGRAPAGFAVGVGQRVPSGQYVYPSRPATLTPLDTGGDLAISDEGGTEYRTAFLLRPDPADPDKPVSRTFTWGKGGHLALISQTPGTLTVTINGTKVASGEWWDYTQGLVDASSSSSWPFPGQRAKGTTVTITVTPHRMTGDWAVAFQQPS